MVDQSRKLEPLYFVSDSSLGFRQFGLDRPVICVENSSNLGKESISKS